MSYSNRPSVPARASNIPARTTDTVPKVVRVADDGKINDIDIGLAGKGKKMKRTYVGLDDKIPDIIQGSRDEYRKFIIDLLETRGNVLREEAEKYTDSSGMNAFEKAVTHDSVNPTARAENYEMLEHLGDASVNKATTWYLKSRFPEIIARGDPGVQIISKQKSLLTSKPYLARYSDMLGLTKFIRYRPLNYTYANTNADPTAIAPVYKKVTLDRSMREDVFEAFFGCLEEVLDAKEDIIGIGYALVYRILASFYSQQYIPTTKNELVDAKTQLKELFDKRKKSGNTIRTVVDGLAKNLSIHIHFEQPPDGGKMYDIVLGPYSTILSGEAGGDYESSQKIAEQIASRAALNYLQKKYPTGGFVRYTADE